MAVFLIDVAAAAAPERQPADDEKAVLVFATQAAAPPDWWRAYFGAYADSFTDLQQPIWLVVQPTADGDITGFLPIAIALSADAQRRVQIDAADEAAARVAASAVVEFWTEGADIVFGAHIVLVLDAGAGAAAEKALGGVVALNAEGPPEALALLRARHFGTVPYADFVREPLGAAECACRLRSYDESLATLAGANPPGAPFDLRPAGANPEMVRGVLAHPRTWPFLRGEGGHGEIVVPSGLLPVVAKALSRGRVRVLLEGPVRDEDARAIGASDIMLDAAADVGEDSGMTHANWIVEAFGDAHLSIMTRAYEDALYFTDTPLLTRPVPVPSERPPGHINVFGTPNDEFRFFGALCRQVGTRRLRLVHTDNPYAASDNRFRIDMRHLADVDAIEVTADCALSFVGARGAIGLWLASDTLRVYVEADAQLTIQSLAGGSIVSGDNVTLQRGLL